MALTQDDWKALVAAIALFLGANLGSFRTATDPGARADPFTGSDGRELRRDLEKYVDRSLAAQEKAILNRFSRNEARLEHVGEDADASLERAAECREGLKALNEKVANCTRRMEYHLQHIHGYKSTNSFWEEKK